MSAGPHSVITSTECRGHLPIEIPFVPDKMNDNILNVDFLKVCIVRGTYPLLLCMLVHPYNCDTIDLQVHN